MGKIYVIFMELYIKGDHFDFPENNSYTMQNLNIKVLYKVDTYSMHITQWWAFKIDYVTKQHIQSCIQTY